MARTFLIVSVVLFSTRFSSVKSDAHFIDGICKHTPNYKKCVSIIHSDPRRSATDVSGLAIIVVDALKTKSQAVMKLLRFKRSKLPALKLAYDSCISYYDAIINADIVEAREALEKGDPKFAQNGMNDAANEASFCETEFKGKSPITYYNQDVHATAAIASSIVQLLL
ncbi:hypothetical protein K2173_017352 [Erythroxylum novogranatense]|uniref:Pectinesterase inhibitor domain-containing protein n=1 Tax=Erythroxylum novogranatense TaxID=1862640 RepID=A0AAV8TKN8_9ROSI|nr:hypothetical protein K2173_017352 [Erythroxylum novogranatense]